MLREFKDNKGVDWLVWDVYPSSRTADQRISDPGAAFPHRELAEGWLCFESSSEKRRVTPIPDGWEFWDSVKLGELCETAGYKSRPGSRETLRSSEAITQPEPPQPGEGNAISRTDPSEDAEEASP